MILRRIVNISFLTLSIGLSAFCLYYSFDNPITQKVVIIFAIMYELGNRYILADAKTQRKKGNRKYAAFLFFCYGIYIIYNILSGAGFFISETFKQDQTSLQTEYIVSSYQKELSEIEERISTLQKALDKEVETTYRSRADKISQELKYYENRREELRNKLITSPTKKNTRKNPFRDLANIIGMSFERFLGLIWCMVMGAVCVVIYITTESLEEEGRQQTSITPVTSTVIPNPVTGEKLCICGCGKPVKGKSLYHSGACRTRVSRNKKNNKGGEESA